MKSKYTKSQILEAIAFWTKTLEGMTSKNESVETDSKKTVKEDENLDKKTLKDKIKEAIAPIGSAASIAKSVATCAEKLPEMMALAQNLTDAINRGAEAMEKLVEQRAGKQS